MPIPTPTPSETESEFVGRCMSEIGNEYDQQQALAICYNTYRQERAEANNKTVEALKQAENQIKHFLNGKN